MSRRVYDFNFVIKQKCNIPLFDSKVDNMWKMVQFTITCTKFNGITIFYIFQSLLTSNVIVNILNFFCRIEGNLVVNTVMKEKRQLRTLKTFSSFYPSSKSYAINGTEFYRIADTSTHIFNALLHIVLRNTHQAIYKWNRIF